MHSFAKTIRTKRKELHLSKKELAKLAGLPSRELLTKIEKHHFVPAPDIRERILAVLDNYAEKKEAGENSTYIPALSPNPPKAKAETDSKTVPADTEKEAAKPKAETEKAKPDSADKTKPHHSERGEKVDLSVPNSERKAEGQRTEKLLFQLNQTDPTTPQYRDLTKELFDLPEDSALRSPVYVNLASNLKIGHHVSIMPYFKVMSAGKVTIEDHVSIALNVTIVTNNHDPYRREVLTVQDVHIKKNAWIGTGSIILPGVTIGKNAIVGAGSVVTKDVPDNAVYAGNPAKLIRMLDADKFEKESGNQKDIKKK